MRHLQNTNATTNRSTIKRWEAERLVDAIRGRFWRAHQRPDARESRPMDLSAFCALWESDVKTALL